MHRLGCRDPRTPFLGPLTPGVKVLSPNTRVDLSRVNVVLHANFQPRGSNGVAAYSGQTRTHARRQSPLL